MFGKILLVSALQIGPFWQQWDGHKALCPVWSEETGGMSSSTDVLWPIFTSHRDWWRFCWFIHWQRQLDTDAYQFEVMPLWFNGKDREGEDYWGLFPLWGHHPHFMFLNDWSFCLWPLWMRYRAPRPSEGREMTTHAVLFPFFHWRDDGSWGVWPIFGTGKKRESDHSYALWPIVTWADYRSDRDSAGAGKSWMLWPLWGEVARERERQHLFLPPFFSFAQATSPVWSARGNSGREIRVRCPWPFFEFESGAKRDRISVFPLYERERMKRYADGAEEGGVTRFGWRLIELYRDRSGEIEESRVFPFWLKNRTYFRIWPFWSSTVVGSEQSVRYNRFLDLVPIRWVEAVDRNWAPYWTLYESVSKPNGTEHSLFWGIIKWRTSGR